MLVEARNQSHFDSAFWPYVLSWLAPSFCQQGASSFRQQDVSPTSDATVPVPLQLFLVSLLQCDWFVFPLRLWNLAVLILIRMFLLTMLLSDWSDFSFFS